MGCDRKIVRKYCKQIITAIKRKKKTVTIDYFIMINNSELLCILYRILSSNTAATPRNSIDRDYCFCFHIGDSEHDSRTNYAKFYSNDDNRCCCCCVFCVYTTSFLNTARLIRYISLTHSLPQSNNHFVLLLFLVIKTQSLLAFALNHHSYIGDEKKNCCDVYAKKCENCYCLDRVARARAYEVFRL